MRRRSILRLGLGCALVALSLLGGLQWRARQRYLTQGWQQAFPAPVADTPGAQGETLSRSCVNAPLAMYTEVDLAWALDLIEAGGFAWVRQQISWADMAPQPGELDWSTMDTVMAALSSHGLQTLAVLDDAPDWVGAPPDPVRYATWAGAVAERYGEHLTYYQIWHNPNLGTSWGGRADPFAYADLLARAAKEIRAVDPNARIILGSLAPTAEAGDVNYAEALFLEMLYAAGAADDFDVVAVQPYGFETGPTDRRVDRDILNFSRVILVRRAMIAGGDAGKAIWAGNYGWNSKPAGWPGGPSIWGSVNAETQAAYTVGALERVAREWPWMGVMCLNGFQPREETPGLSVADAEEHWGFALVGPERTTRPVYDAVRAWAAQETVARTGVYRADTDLASFDGPWTLGPQGADIGESGVNRVSLPFEGTGVALTVRRGPYRAFLYVTVDGEPAPALPRDREGRSYVVLYDPLAATATVPLAEGLPSGEHRVNVVAERGWGQWALADWRVVDAPLSSAAFALGYGLYGVLGSVGLALVGYSFPAVLSVGRRLQRLWARLADWLQVVISFCVTVVALFSAWQLLMGEAVFRRLGSHGDVVALALTAGLFYLSPWTLLTIAAGALLALIVALRPSLGLMLTLFAAPLHAYPLSIAGKSFALAELVLLPTLLGAVLQLYGHIRRQTMSVRQTLSRVARGFLPPLLLLVGVSVLSCTVAEHLREAVRELRLVVIEPVLFFLMLIALPLGRRERWRVIDALVASGLMVALVGLAMYFSGAVITAEGGSRRLLSVYGSPNNVGLFLGRVVPLLVAYVLWAGPQANDATRCAKYPSGLGIKVRAWAGDLLKNRRRIIYLLALLPIGIALMLSLSRGAIVLGIPTALLLMGWFAGKGWRRATVVVLVLGAIALIPLLSTPRFAGMLDLSRGTTGFRVSLWHSTWQLIKEYPWLGVGLDNFLYAYRTRYVLPTAWEEFNLSHPHNVLLDFTARLGIGGLIAFLWWQVVFWRATCPLRKHEDAAIRALGIGVAGSMADFLAHGLVDAAYFIVDLAYVAWFSAALIVWLSSDSGFGVDQSE